MSVRHTLALLAVLTLAGCATGPIGAYQPSMDHVQSLRQSNMGPTAVGEFGRVEQLPAARDKSVSVRGSSISSPSGTFSAYLKEALAAELRSAGKFDAASPTVITGQLAQNDLNAAGFSTANSTLAARFAVTRGGTSVYDKVVSAGHEWPSSFMGAIAIPDAINNYTQMYARLLDKLFADEEFKAAVAAK